MHFLRQAIVMLCAASLFAFVLQGCGGSDDGTVTTGGTTSPTSGGGGGGGSSAVDPFDRSSVSTFYNTEYPKSQGVAIGWTGSVASCDAGDVSSDFRSATVTRINLFRALVGLPDVSLDGTGQNGKCQEAALMMSANGALSHNPPNTWDCWTADGDEAAGKSNLALGINGAGAIDLYIDDPGSGNAPVGHRRWLLYPRLSKVGTGSVPCGSGSSAANAVWVIGNTTTRPSTPSFVAWPNAGYVPYQLLPDSRRWSYHRPGVDFSSATVTVEEGGSTVSTTIVARNGSYGDPALVWTMPFGSSKPSSDTTYDVTIKADGSTYTYSVTVFDPAVSSAVTKRALVVDASRRLAVALP